MFNQLSQTSFTKKKILAVLLQLLVIIFVLNIFVVQKNISMGLLFLLGCSISLYFINAKKIVLFESFTLFSAYFYSVIISCLSIFYSDFQGTHYLTSQYFSYDLPVLFNITLLYLIVCYIFAYLGYKSFRQKFTPNIDLYSDGISTSVVQLFIIVFAIIGLGNFYVNILKFAGGNPLIYLTNVSLRHMEFSESGGTTAGYLLGYMAGYLWLYKLTKLQQKLSFYFLSYVAITVVLKASTGRIIGTMIYTLSYFMLYYFLNYQQESKKHKKYALTVVIFIFCAVVFYFLRVISSLNHIGKIDSNLMEVMFSFVNIDVLNYYLVDKGNIPNVGVLMKIIDAWSNDLNYFYGKSLFTWVYGVLPSSIRPENYQISILIKETWYLGVKGGALPPTGMGEMFVNFGYFGGIFGMYIFGAFTAFIFNMLKIFNNYWYLLIYTNITLGFVLIYPKGEFDNLSLWYIIPPLFTYSLLIFISKLTRKNRSENLSNNIKVEY